MLAAVSLDDKYALDSGRVYLSGVQALVRLPMDQRRTDEAAGLNTGFFVSGYRGSPLGGLDQQFLRAKPFLERHHIQIRPAVNEDMGATAVWGSQQTVLGPGARYDGVVGMWYGKGPGVDRCGDVFKHGNLAGSSKYGGVLLLAGDDHAAKSSTAPHQSEYSFIDASVPVLNPSGVQEVLDYGRLGVALSRYSGCWIGLKTIAETVDSSASVYVDPQRIDLVTPEDFELPPGGLNIRWPDPPMDQEYRLHKYKLYAALAFARANRLDRVVIDCPQRRFGIVTTGKSYFDVRQALDDLGIDEELAAEIGLVVYKVGMSWPLERDGIRRFAEGLEEVLVVEEKRAVIENQLKEQLYNWRADVRPRVIGKFDEAGDWILPSTGELTPAGIARAIAARIERFHTSERLRERLAFLGEKEAALASLGGYAKRIPYFCSGCPHNTSTNVPEGSRALAGIGCHYMVTWMDRRTDTFSQMGGEGVTWVGQAPFTDEKHLFVNLGDGTYFHSGSLAIRQAIAAGVNITYKILYNDAVAMTGGQPVDGQLTVPQMTHQLAAEGVAQMLVVTDEPEKYGMRPGFADGVTVRHRDELDAVQRELREVPGVTVLIYDQTCAAEKRRRRKRGLFPDPPKRVFINDRVCEGCGDCSVQSNCLSVIPAETEFGRKRAIDQSSCNKDYSCLKGFCPSFVTVEGGRLRRPQADVGEPLDPRGADLPAPRVPAIADQPYNVLITGVGGTGVVTVGALLGMAAHIEGKGVSVLDMTGLAQKGGAVTSHVRIARQPEDIQSVRLAAGTAELVLGCDIMVAASFDALAKMRAGVTHCVINEHRTYTGEFTQNPDMVFGRDRMRSLITDATAGGDAEFLDATRLATRLLGNSIGANLFLLGYAWQKGFVPISYGALLKAVELNGVAVELNKKALMWGRCAAFDLTQVEGLIADESETVTVDRPPTLDELVARRRAELVQYQNAAYADRYSAFVEQVRAAEQSSARGKSGLAEAVARYYYKLLAYKDEYEVARLHTDRSFLAKLNEQFEGGFKVKYHLAPPILTERDPVTGIPAKKEYGPWMRPVFRMLARLKFLRGTSLDPFGRTAERRIERALIREYETVVRALIRDLTYENHEIAVEIASLPERIRGYGHVKEANVQTTKAREAELLAAFRNPAPTAQAAE